MNAHQLNREVWQPGRMFYFGLALVLLALWLPFIPSSWSTFIHMWRVDLAASIFLLFVLGWLALNADRSSLILDLSDSERWTIIAPIVAFIIWSGLSIFWAPSWKSAVHHTVVWIEYLAFYFLFRHLVDTGRDFGKLLTTFIITLGLFAIPAIIESLALTAFGGETLFRGRYGKYGEQIVTILPLLFVVVMRLDGKNFRLGVLAISLLWLLVYTPAGRANILLFIGAVTSIGFVVFVIPRWRRYRSRFAICMLSVVLAPLPFYLFSLATASGQVEILERLNDSTGAAFSRDFRVLMNSVSLQMIEANPLTGVGADNYGMQFGAYREQYAAANPNDPNLSYGEEGLVWHAHNEFLQIAAELGLVGLGIFLWLVAGVGLMAWKVVRNRFSSLYATAAIAGLALFLVSSLVSAYSFRLMQNGLVFFFVLAVAARCLLKAGEDKAAVPRPARGGYRLGLAAGIAACLMLGTYSAVRVGSVILATRANHTQELETAGDLYRLGMVLDDENPDIRNNFGMRLFMDDQFAEAVPLLKEAVRIGRTEAVDFSYLASAQTLAGDHQGAENTFAEALRLYPRSAFVLTRYATLLTTNGKHEESSRAFERALSIDTPSANTWRMIIEKGAQAATDRAFVSKDYRPVMDLWPRSSMYAVLEERHIRYPHERLVFPRRRRQQPESSPRK